MASRALPLPRTPRFGRATPTSLGLSAAAFGVAALLAGVLVYDTKVGVALLLALCFVPLALFRLRIALCAWITLLFFSRTSALEAIPNKLLLFILASWLALLVGRRAKAREALAQNRAVIVWALAFVVWTILTLAWAPVPGAAERPIKELLYALLGLVLVLGIVLEREHVRWLMMAFVLGAALSVLWGAAKGGLSLSGGGGGEVANLEGRFQGGSGDPNYLAAVLVPAIMLAGGLAIWRSSGRRAMLALATAIIAVGLAATQSRGGLIAAVVCGVVALAIWRGRRGLILGLIGLAALATVVFFAANPAAWHRISAGNSSGSGRVDIWTVAWRVVHDHPFAGVGIAQFPQVSPHYVLQPGVLEYVSLIVEKHIVVHNLYLQLWVETGIVGLLLFVGLIVTSVAAALRAARRFELQDDEEMSALARAAALALIAMLTASFFLSNLEAGQLWVLLALGPVLAGLADRQARARRPVEVGV
ncbi:MAG TPA: O-antigen ligase family protein [Solirubrobacteraceae bacterium]|nr:O-antigen ligase family protein [Solirubrobacteraceae bacterium]